MQNILQTVNETSLHEEHGNIHDVLYIGLFVIVSLWIAQFLNLVYVKFKKISEILPSTVSLLLLGTVLGLLHKYSVFGEYPNWTSPLGDSIYNWIYLDPHTLLHIFIPPLIFESASTIDHHIFMHSFSQSFVLAVPGVIINILFISLFTNYIETTWSYFTCLAFSSILAATDPVAVVSLLKNIGAPKQLGILIEGESLLNDGVAYVFFVIFHNIIRGTKEFTFLYLISELLYTSILGSLIGYVCGMFTIYLLGKNYDNSVYVITTSLAGCWGCFYITESLHVSGVLSLVNYGLQFSKSLRTTVSLDVQENMHTVWEVLGYVSNTIVFIYSGVIISNFIQFENISSWLNLIYLYISLQIIRTLSIILLFKCLKNDGYGLNLREFSILSWAGLRGAVGLILGLMIVNDDRLNQHIHYNQTNETLTDRIMFYITGIVFLSMLINATTTKYLVKCLGLDLSTASSEKMFNNIVDHLESYIKEIHLECKNNSNYIGTDFDYVYSKLPTNIPKYSASQINISLEIEKIGHGENISDNEFLLTEFRRKYLSFMRIHSVNDFGKKVHGSSSVYQIIEHSIDVVEDYIYSPESNNLNYHFWEIIGQYCNYDNMIKTANLLDYLPRCLSKILKLWFLNRKISFGFDLASKMLNIISKSNKSFENFVTNELKSNYNLGKITEIKDKVLLDISDLTLLLNDYNSSLSSLNVIKNIKNQYVHDIIIKKSEQFINNKLHSGEINEKEYNKIKQHLKYYNFGNFFQGLDIHTNKLHNLTYFKDFDKDLLKDLSNNLIEVIFHPGDIILNNNENADNFFIIIQGEVCKIKPNSTKENLAACKLQNFVRNKLNFVTEIKNKSKQRKSLRKFSLESDTYNFNKKILTTNDTIGEDCIIFSKKSQHVYICQTLVVVYKLNKNYLERLFKEPSAKSFYDKIKNSILD